jgi:CHAD domain-containing protein
VSKAPKTRVPSVESPMGAVRRLFVERLESAARTLDRGTLPDAAIHEIRKDLKCLRASLRLLRAVMGAPAYRRDNRLLRDAARPLTSVRDAFVLLATLEAAHQGKSTSAAFRNLRQALHEDREKARTRLKPRELTGAAATLREVEARASSLPVDRARSGLRKAVKRAYRKAREAGRLARRRPSDERLHEWRKQVNYLVNQLKMVSPSKAGGLVKLRKKSRKLAQRLGDDHDLAVLRQKIETRRSGLTDARERDELSALMRPLRAERAKLQRRSFRLGRQLYAPRPGRLPGVTK